MSDFDAIIENLAEEFTACLRAGKSPDIESYAERYPSHSDEIHEVLASIEMMEQLSCSESDTRERANSRFARRAIERLGDFDIVREIGRGGMGVVYEAVDRTLQRRVALKVLNDSALTTQKHIDRFRRESRLAAQLHHTNIVPVFGVGEEEQKQFYAMQYVEGVSVQDIIEGMKYLLASVDGGLESPSSQWNAVDGLRVATAFQGGEFADSRKTNVSVMPGAASAALDSLAPSQFESRFHQTIDFSDEHSNVMGELDRQEATHAVSEDAYDATEQASSAAARFGDDYWRSVTRVGLQVSDALHYAHVQGILHRDIKPANLLFDSNGTVWVADFGLAKLSETDDLTQTGDVVGTLKYMAPEQLAGKADARTDIYGLGLTLYELLTLRAVHDGETYESLFSQKQNAKHAAPRKFVPTIPRDLETIVQKALEFDSDKRYASAREMHEDLQRFLDDRPILARRVTLAEQAWRWCRRNKQLATMGAMLFALLVTLPIILGGFYLREAKHKRESELTTKVVLDGFDDMFMSYLDTDVATASTLTSNGANSANLAPAMLTKDTAEVMEKMLRVYDQLAERKLSSMTASLAIESAKARRRVGDLYRKLGRFEKAKEAYDDAATRYANLGSGGSAHQVEVARIHHAIGAMYEQQEEMDLAKTEYAKALESISEMGKDDEALFELARTHYLLAKDMSPEGRGRDRPDRRPGPRSRVMRPPDGPAETGHEKPIEETRKHLNSAIELLTQLRARNSDHAEYRFMLALCLRERDANAAIALLRALVEEFPAVQRYRFELCETYRTFTSPDTEPELRTQHLHMAKDLAEQLVKEQRDAAAYRINLAHTYVFLGLAKYEAGNMRDAEACTRLALTTHASVVEDFPGLASLSERLSNIDRLRLSGWLFQLGRYEELIDLLQPYGDRLFDRKEDARVKGQLPTLDDLQALAQCRELLLSAYERLDDDIGYFVVLAWLSDADVSSGLAVGDVRPGDPGPGGVGPNHGPPPNSPRRRAHGLGEGGGMRQTSQVDLAMSYDANNDSRLTRDEVPQRMSQEWFKRADMNNDGEVDRAELQELLESHSRRP